MLKDYSYPIKRSDILLRVTKCSGFSFTKILTSVSETFLQLIADRIILCHIQPKFQLSPWLLAGTSGMRYEYKLPKCLCCEPLTPPMGYWQSCGLVKM